LTSERLHRVVRDAGFDPARVTVSDRETYSELTLDEQVLGIITDEDAQAVGQPRPEYARQVRDRLVEIVTTTREELSAWATAVGLLWAAVATTILVALLVLLARLRRRVHARIDARLQGLTESGPGGAAAVRATRVGSVVHGTVSVAAAAAAVALAAVWAEVVLQVIPWSRPLGRLIYRYLADPIRTLWLGLLGLVPNFFYLAVIGLTTFVVLKVVHLVFKEVEVGTIRFASFPDEWAEPTYKLVRTLLLAVAFVGAFPYIPGSQSLAFQGISLFLGLLVSLSSSSALSNIIAGTILTYTRAFRLGDIVRIGDTVGEVMIKRLLVTHVRTYKNVVVSIPNSVILTTQVLNYTTLAANRGLVLHTSVTIGYDAPWAKVHELLIAAALRTEGVLKEPPPYVLQRALNDFSVEYEINAFVAAALPMPHTYSALHANIQECFNEAGVEIMSPNYFALRDGNQVTTPRQHLPSDYIAPAFRVHYREAHDVPSAEDITADERERDVASPEVAKSALGPRKMGT
jgi:small-conductance mechanosensitive channel